MMIPRHVHKLRILRKMEDLDLTIDAKQAIGENTRKEQSQHKRLLKAFNSLTGHTPVPKILYETY